jgi:hypothetical protein
VANLLDITKLVRPYSQLKERLMSAHELTPIQRARRIMQMPDLGTQKPSQLLAAILEWCPRGEEGSPFFIAAFLCRLPNELRVLLGHDDFTDLKAVSQKAVKKKSSSKKNIIYCWRHHQFGAKAYNCADPSVCMWAEN